jgi:hypothetical protein
VHLKSHRSVTETLRYETLRPNGSRSRVSRTGVSERPTVPCANGLAAASLGGDEIIDRKTCVKGTSLRAAVGYGYSLRGSLRIVDFYRRDVFRTHSMIIQIDQMATLKLSLMETAAAPT